MFNTYKSIKITIIYNTNQMAEDNNKESCILECPNRIQQIAVRDLMNNRYFFIPAYQRGYRWGKTQIYDLCNDLLDYALKKKKQIDDGVKNQSFYCLQPVISIPTRFKIKSKGLEVNGYEVVDGQQRLTSLFILYRYLVCVNNNLNLMQMELEEKDSLVRGRYGTQLYHLYYETRPDDFDTIEKIGYELLRGDEIVDIDMAHISNAFQYIREWYSNKEEGAP